MTKLLLKTTLSIILISVGLLMLPTNFATAQSYSVLAESLQNSMHTRFISSNSNYYMENNTDKANFHYWWNANGVDALTDGFIRTRQEVYKQRMLNLVRGIKTQHGSYNNDFYDDMEWLAISSLRAYEHTGVGEYLDVTNLLWTYIKTGSHPEHGGAIQWNKSKPANLHACSNAPAIILATRLYRVSGNVADLNLAKSIFAWMKDHLIDPSNGAVWDAYITTNDGIGKSIYSYNVGTWIGAGLELYKATSDISYLDAAVKTAEFAMTQLLYNGVLFNNETGSMDGGLFKGIFLRYFALLAREGNIPQATKDRYISAIRSTADAVKNIAVNHSNYLSNPNWNVTAGTTAHYSSQLTGVKVIEAAATVDEVFVYKNINYGGYSCSLSPGNYTLAQLIARGVRDNDITSFTIPQGFTMTVFENDNFSGASAIYTSNSGWIGSWNDKISSVKIESSRCTPTPIVPYISVNGASWQSVNAVETTVGSSVTIGPQPLNGTWSWIGPGGFTSSSRRVTLPNIQTNHKGNYTAAYTIDGCTSYLTFTVIVNASAARSAQPVNSPVQHEATFTTSGYPNPFYENVKILVNLPEAGHTRITVFNGITKINDLHDGYLNAGDHEFEFKANTLASGMYIYTIVQKGKTKSSKIIKK
jgi:predicted alpha-1,6-mannanase (GH76 family)